MSLAASAASAEGVEATRKKLLAAGSLHWAHWLIVSLSLLFAVVAWRYSLSLVKGKAEARFERAADQVVQQLRERMQEYEGGLWGGAGALRSHGRLMTHAEWSSFTSTIDLPSRYPGINGIGLILPVEREEIDEFVAARRKTWPQFAVKPEHDQPEHLVITYVEPLDVNLAAHGLDIAHEENRYQGAKRARDSGQATITGPITLVQDAQRTPGFLFYVPSYEGSHETLVERRRSFVGLVYAPFVVQRLMKGVLSSDRRQVGIRILDGETVLYDELQPDRQDYDPNPEFRGARTLELYGRTWRFEVRSSRSFRSSAESSQPLTILICGVLLDLFLLAMFLLLSRSNRRAVEFADAANQDLRVKQADLEAATEDLKLVNADLESFVHVASHDLKSPLRAIDNLAKWISEDLGSEQLDPETEDNLRLLRSRVARMETLLNGLLKFSRISRQEFSLEPVSKASVEDVIALLDLPEGFRVSLDWQVPEFMTGRVPFEIVIRNLVANSLKHHDRSEGLVEVSARADGEAWAEVRISDDGPGISEEFHERVFRMFETLRPRDEVEAGGVGLALVKKAVCRYGGTVHIEPSAERGSVFVVRWPLVQASAAEESNA